ncbi:MAG: Gfo/Idh/MocA family oxidoreductase [Bacteroidales bacterium]|jgi:predicted dehydrogenase|nr:Gfo/Idh/MocA family oxidoreductase [Bacteroidales bacterium]
MVLDRREFIRNSTLAGLGVAFFPNQSFGSSIKQKLSIGFIGMGLRGMDHLMNALERTDIQVKAICDIDKERLKLAQDLLKEEGKSPALEFGKDEYDYRNLLELNKIDAVIIATPWVWHTPMSVDSMKAGKYTGVEVSAAMTTQECWDLVNTHEATGTHLMILENVNYRRDVMAVLNMVRQDVFGELMHFRCGYQHDLREVKFNDGVHAYGHGVEFGEKGFSEARWRTLHSLKKNGDIYPTHGLGPVATYANINRGNRFVSLTSHATKARGLHNHIVEKGGKDHPNAKLKWKLGDIVTTTIDTANGETIIVTHDTNLPRPYSLGFRVQGTKGIWEADGKRIYIEGEAAKAHRWEDADKCLEKYDHPLWKKFSEDAEGAGHGGMDFFVLNAFVESAKRQIAPPMDVYDAAAWSSITPLSETSIAEGGQVQHFPDFTRGRWIKRRPYDWIKDTF